jgi:hypothetical protein
MRGMKAAKKMWIEYMRNRLEMSRYPDGKFRKEVWAK